MLREEFALRMAPRWIENDAASKSVPPTPRREELVRDMAQRGGGGGEALQP